MSKLTIVLIFMLISACHKDNFNVAPTFPVSTTSSDPAQPILSHSQQGEASRAYVFSYEGLTVLGLVIPDKDLSFLLGFKYREFCQGDFSNIDVSTFHDVVKNEPDGIPRVHRLLKNRDIVMEIWPFADLTFGADCQIYFDNDPIFSGRVDFKFTDNDYFSFQDDGHNINSFGFVAKGEGIQVVWRGLYDSSDDIITTIACKIKYDD